MTVSKKEPYPTASRPAATPTYPKTIIEWSVARGTRRRPYVPTSMPVRHFSDTGSDCSETWPAFATLHRSRSVDCSTFGPKTTCSCWTFNVYIAKLIVRHIISISRRAYCLIISFCLNQEVMQPQRPQMPQNNRSNPAVNPTSLSNPNTIKLCSPGPRTTSVCISNSSTLEALMNLHRPPHVGMWARGLSSQQSDR